MTTDTKPIAIYYEHPDWFRPLFAELERRGHAVPRHRAARHQYDPGEAEQELCAALQSHEPVGLPARRGQHSLHAATTWPISSARRAGGQRQPLFRRDFEGAATVAAGVSRAALTRAPE